MELRNALDAFYYSTALCDLRLMNQQFVDKNITYNSLLYLDLIAYRENFTASYLAKALHISRPAVTAKVNELIRQGLVEKRQSPADRRVYYLSVKPHVAAEYSAIDRRVAYAVEKMESRFSSEAIGQFCEMMEAFAACYREGGGKNA